MGCNGSKAVVVAAPGGTVVLQQQEDDSSKPWKKNQVVPAPSPAAEGPSRQHPPLKAATAFAATSKDTKQGADQGPADVLGSLKELCAEKVEGGKLAQLAERIYEALKQHLPGALRSATSPKDSTAIVELAKRAVLTCNSILQPVLSHINRVLSNRQAGSSWSETTSWEQVEFSDFLGVLEDACTATYDQGVMEVGRPVAALMELIYELRQHCQNAQIRIPDGVTQVAALDELIGMLGIIFFRKVVLETAESARAKLEQYQQLQEQVGWSDAQLGCCTGPEARAMLMYLNQVSAAGEKRTNVMVRRCAAFWDAFEAARKDGLLPTPSGPMSHKYFPLFVDEFAHGAGKAGEAAAASGRKPAVEAGEGHGPRKEFFSLAGQDMSGQQPPNPVITTAGSAAAAESAAGGGDSGGAPGRPDSASSQRPSRPPLWVYNRTAGAFWYNTGLTESAELRGAYAFAGWLIGQSLLNRAPLGLRLPPVLFRALLEGPSGTSTAASGSGAPAPGFQPTLDMLAEFDPDAASGVRNVASLPGDQLRGMLELEGLPTDWTAERYTLHAVATVLRDSVAWQATSVAAGFFAAVDRRLLRTWQMGPEALAALVGGGGAGGAAAGEVPADLSALFRLAIDEELSGPSALLVELLWQVLGAWPAKRRLRFVEFVTGTSRLPLPGSELLKIQAPFVAMGAAEHQATLGMLPQAHTCDNLLELPNYWESLLAVRGVRGGPLAVSRGTAALSEDQLSEMRAEVRRILDDRLTLAVLNFQGYGLDERSGGGGGGWGGEDQDEAGGLGGMLSGPEPSPEPDLELKPAALTADSLASLARLSASSSMLHSSHPLAFSTAGLNAVASPSGGQRGGGAGGGRLGPGPNPPGAPSRPAAPSGPAGLIRGSAPSGVLGSERPAAQQQLTFSVDARPMSHAERQASFLARFDIDAEDKKGSGGGASGATAAEVPPRRPSSSDEDNDVFK